MLVRYNQAWSKWHTLVGGGTQGSWTGQMCYIGASDDAASWMEDENRYKFCDDLSILELVAIGGILTDYNFQQHVASDIGIYEKLLTPEHLKTQQNLNQVADWTERNLMKLNEAKTNYIIFTRSNTKIATRLNIYEKVLEKKKFVKILGMWLQEDAGWNKNTLELCKKAYSRLSMLTKLRYAGVSMEDLITVFKLFIRSTLEYNSVAFHSSLSSQQEDALERCQSVCLRVILQDSYISYSSALEMAGAEISKAIRETRCLVFSLKCLKKETNKRFFPINPNNLTNVRSREKYKVNFAYTNAYKNSAIPYFQRLLNQREEMRRREEKEGGEGKGGGEERTRGRGE